MSPSTRRHRASVAPARALAVILALAGGRTTAVRAAAGTQGGSDGIPVATPNAVELHAADGVRLAGFWLDCHLDGAPTAILLHNNGRDHFGWAPLWTRLQRANCNVLAIDLRGHGASRKFAPEKYDRLVARDGSVYREMVLDAEAGVDFLMRQHGIKPADIVVIGGELGCGIGFDLMSRNPKLRAMVALSPSRYDFGFDTLALVQRYGRRPLLLVTMKVRLDDGPQAIADTLRGRADVTLEVYHGADVRGQDLLRQPAQVERLIVNWMHDIFQVRR